MTTPTDRPPMARRLAAILSIALVVVVAIATVVLAIDRVGPLIAVLALDAVIVLAGWYALTRAGTTRLVAVAFGIAAVAAVVAVVVSESAGWSLVWRLALLVVAVALARYALSRDVRTLKSTATTGTPVPAAEHGVLIMNLKSGGGKAEKFHLADECRARGIEPVVLQPGDDMLDLARDAIDRGADVIGMAGGDGSQALVASVAAERGIPMVVIPAGTQEPPRPRPRDRPRRRRGRARRVRRRGRAAHGSRRGERPRVREQRLPRALRRDRPIARVPRREGGHHAVGAPPPARARLAADGPPLRRT